jgi:hypothetical protein
MDMDARTFAFWSIMTVGLIVAIALGYWVYLRA